MLFYLFATFGLISTAFALWMAFVFYNFHYSAHKRGIRSAAAKLPGLDTKPLIGNLTQVPRDQKYLVNFFTRLAVDFQGLCYLFLGPEPFLFLGKANHAGVVFKGSKHSEKATTYYMFHPWLGTGLLTSDGEKWRTRRKMLTPAFHFDILDRSLATMMKHCSVAIGVLNEKADEGGFVDVWDTMSLLALDIVSDAAMGVDLGSLKRNPASLEYVDNRATVTEMMMDRFKNPLLWNDVIYNYLTPVGRKFNRTVAALHTFTTNVITTRWAEIKDQLDEVKEKRRSFLDLLLIAKQEHGLSFVDIREEVDTFMFEGHDTTAAAMSFVLQMLCNYPEVMQKLQEEVDEAFATVALEEENVQEVKKVLQSMPYLDAVLKEGLRMFPSVPSIGRTLTDDIEIEGYKLLQGTQVILHIYAIHHDPELYSEPYTFNPDRWINKEVPIDEHPYCYVPFSAGPRNCIGQKFALLEDKLIISSIARHFDLKSDTEHKDMEVFGQVIMRPVKYFNIKFTRRSEQK
ncbi:cytochrome P450 4V2-like isoform X1 [Symsagittifera roscoffensis]|uniref:cytochrome P450 4V2-like isoform X1 n=1 Tax=Symsagittifera roscoffensis TaxID=84072 RepID=UPI00307B4661